MKKSFSFPQFLTFLSISMSLSFNLSASSLSEDHNQKGMSIMMKSSKDIVTDDKELTIIKGGIVNYDKDLAEISQKLAGKQDVPTFENFLKGYKNIEVTGKTDLEDAVKKYRNTHPKVDENSSVADLVQAYKDAIIFHYTLEGADDRSDEFLSMMISIRVSNVLGAVDSIAGTMFNDMTHGKKSKLDGLKEVRDMESSAEKTIQRLQTKKKLINELRSRRLFLELLNSKL